jgi:hypothetical protein
MDDLLTLAHGPLNLWQGFLLCAIPPKSITRHTPYKGDSGHARALTLLGVIEWASVLVCTMQVSFPT